MATTTNSAKVTLPTDTQILITREFDAPRHLVWKAYTTPDLIARWWGGSHGKVTSAEVDLRVGGSWRYVLAANEGFEVAFHGEFREISAPDRLVNTEIYEGAPEGMGVVTTTFTETDGHTTLTPPATDPSGWPTTVQRALGRLAPLRPSAQGATP